MHVAAGTLVGALEVFPFVPMDLLQPVPDWG